MLAWILNAKDEARVHVARTFWTAVLFIAALLAPFLVPYVGLLVALVLFIVWYACIGHHYVSFGMDGFAADTVHMLHRRALKLLRRGRAEQALETCQHWIQIDPWSADPHLMAARILATHLQRPDRAIGLLQHALELSMGVEALVEIAIYLGVLYGRKGLPQEAQAVYEHLRRRFPGAPALGRLPRAPAVRHATAPESPKSLDRQAGQA